MESLRHAERLRDLQAANRRRLAGQDVAAEDLPDLISEAYKAHCGELSGLVITPFVFGAPTFFGRKSDGPPRCNPRHRTLSLLDESAGIQ